MSTTTTATDMARSPFSTAAFAQLVRRLRHTNARYNQIALQFRCRIRPTHHARRRASRAGLRIDILKARACPARSVSTHPPPVIDSSVDTPGWADAQAMEYATTDNAIGSDGRGASNGNAYMRSSALRKLPNVTARRQRRRDERQRVMLRIPPLKLRLNVDHPSGAGASQFLGSVPGAPRLLPRQLPEDECGTEDMALESASYSSPSMHASGSLLAPVNVQVYSGLCITISPRSLKRRLQDDEVDVTTAPPPQQPKRLKIRWNESQIQ